MSTEDRAIDTRRVPRPLNTAKTGKDLRVQLARLEARLARIEAHQHNADREISTDWDDRAIELQNDEVVEALLPHTRREIFAIRRALARIDAGDEVACEGCGEAIPPRRLALVPDTRFCASCVS
jgi:RNA polymerase-binding transcription factor DksA